jgi:hypothetical protein
MFDLSTWCSKRSPFKLRSMAGTHLGKPNMGGRRTAQAIVDCTLQQHLLAVVQPLQCGAKRWRGLMAVSLTSLPDFLEHWLWQHSLQGSRPDYTVQQVIAHHIKWHKRHNANVSGEHDAILANKCCVF